MRLSVIIVNYNVCYFLEQCLYTVEQAIKGIEAEIIVVDNASVDDSREMLPKSFPDVQFIWNKVNSGFGRANNQGMALARGDFMVLLNPDTLVPQEIFRTCLDFYAKHPEAGGVGMRMFDGQGQYLPESKRGWPSVSAAFFKLSGLTALFPKNPVLARYYMGHLSPEKKHPVEVLAGAFMFLPRVVYERVGGFDEQFFMYGEDIDLSYRISLAGFTNYYLPEPGIVHFKGESTLRNTTNTRHFYAAMQIFVRKYYPGHSVLWKVCLEAGIKGRELVARLAGKKKLNTAVGKISGWRILGDKESMEEIMAQATGIQIDPGSNSGCIYALGNNFGLQQVFDSWEKDGPPSNMRFHGKGTCGIIGSDDKNGLGEVIILKK